MSAREQPDFRPRSPRAAARSELYGLADLLLIRPNHDREGLRSSAANVSRAWDAAGLEHGLGSRLLRNFLKDLPDPFTTVEGPYYANQLTLAADRIE